MGIAVPFFLWAILFGAVFGALSGFLVKRRDPGSIITRILIGFFGGIIGIVIIAVGDVILAPPIEHIGIIAAGAVVLLFIYSLLVDKRKTK